MTNRDTLKRDAERLLELEESAEGTELFRTPGDELQVAKAMDQAEASGWIPEREFDRVVVPEECAHRDALRQAMGRLEEAAAGPSSAPGWRAELESALTEVRDALAVHTSATESPDGFLEDVLVRAPRLSSEVKEIRKEHQDLRQVTDKAVALVGADASTKMIRRRVMQVLGRFAAHRQRGSDLVYEAYSVDLGVGD